MSKSIRNFLLLLAGIVILFCASMPDFLDAAVAAVRALFKLIGMGWLADLMIATKIITVLVGTGLAAAGLTFSFLDSQARRQEPDWVTIGCTAGGVFFTLLSLIPVLFFIGLIAVPAYVVAMVFAFKGVEKEWANPASKIAAGLFVAIGVGLYVRTVGSHLLLFLCAIGAFVYFAITSGKLGALLDPKGASGMKLMMIASIVYAVACLLFFIPILPAIIALAGWILLLISYINLMGSTSFGTAGNKPGLFMLIGLLVGLLSGLPLFNIASVVLQLLGWYYMIDGLESKNAR